MTTVFIAVGTQKTIVGWAQSDDSFLFRIAPSESITWPPGRHGWQRTATDSTDTYTIASGVTEVLPGFAAQVAGGDPRSYWERVIDAIEATMEGRATVDMNQYAFNGRSLTKMTISELMSFHGYATSKLNAYLQKTGQGGKSRIIRTVL